jgi:hypothetical protein
MPDAFTAHYNFTKPEVSASRDTWGDKQNADMDTIDTLLWNLSEGKLDKAGGVLTNLPTYGGSALATQGFVTNAVNTAVAAVTAAYTAAIAARVPAGTIVLWYGATVGSIPAGWVLCNGANGTPNLMDRFVAGAGSAYAPWAVGGSISHDHGGTGNTWLDWSQMPVHNHGVSDPGHAHSVYDPGHSHSYAHPNALGTAGSGFSNQTMFNNVGDTTGASGTGISIYGAGTGITIQNAGSGAPHSHGISLADHRPPFAALYYIMKV